MILSTNGSSAFRAAGLLHWHATLSNCKLLTCQRWRVLNSNYRTLSLTGWTFAEVFCLRQYCLVNLIFYEAFSTSKLLNWQQDHSYERATFAYERVALIHSPGRFYEVLWAMNALRVSKNVFAHWMGYFELLISRLLWFTQERTHFEINILYLYWQKVTPDSNSMIAWSCKYGVNGYQACH